MKSRSIPAARYLLLSMRSEREVRVDGQMVWIADPQARAVYAYRPLTDVREFTERDNLPGDNVLPGCSVSVAQLFED